MNHTKHLYLMVGLAAMAAILYFTGLGGGGLILVLWVVGCGVMMFLMMRGMDNPGDGHDDDQNRTSGIGSNTEPPPDAADHDPSRATHPDWPAHSARD